ncbi:MULTISPECIES: hypothetical protein [Mesorhizobium]|uniref:Uncharacterized protein n=1 Tax=Mesorhizobium abyssinicae TaxID=1209958 RepID=A0ABU5AQJ4_9HYPH|nr:MULTISPECIES: hypothetical protein [Mesorhizobium]MDX8437077.1 hypothetical protein [Mesorhizobium abyssinicae]MDX8539577.1 hypothetical protein [Mesorhizobium abyssinicae]RVD30356.1 hypothetical protein EN738_06575 [Mesorhizobium sp. M4B.F.Ca.ET.017.02.2.1]RWX66887.1 hypothetical protein EN780_13805 [Mesorhizobium sp. M4B.F.Ca.ET.089.01.1.1]
MLFAAFTGGFLGCSWVRGRIDTRQLMDNVFYREKTFLRQLFFRESAARLRMRRPAGRRLKAIPLYGSMR